MVQFTLILVILVLALIGMGVRMLLVKNGEMRAGCAGKNPMLQEEGVACGLCGAKPGEVCQGDETQAA
ncbi:MAG: membrane or secreted protein [Bacteroidia bacterium]|nr:membrane or secreted protein [Bacteroidia bacterium]